MANELLIKIKPKDAIAAFCCECMGNSGVAVADIRACSAKSCPLFALRPYQTESEIKGYLTSEAFANSRGFSCFSKDKIAKIAARTESLDEILKRKAQRSETMSKTLNKQKGVLFGFQRKIKGRVKP